MNVGFLRSLAADVLALGGVRAPAEDLVTRLQRGDSAALAEAYDRYHAQVRGFARRLLGDNAAAEDLLQETFVTLPAAIKNYRGDASLGTFVLSIAANHARHFVRSAARRRRMLEELSAQPRASAPAPDPEDSAARRQTAEVLARALDTLSLEERVTFVLCEVEERPSLEAAKILGIPDATVRSRLFRARKRLRARLDGEEF